MYNSTTPNEPRKINPKIDYIYQCFSAVHTKQTLALDCCLSEVGEKDNIPVLSLHNGFSRFVLGFIDNSGATRQILRANIKAEEAADLLDQYEDMRHELFRWRFSHDTAAPADKLPPAYTVSIRAGEMKGKTPAEVLLADPMKKGELIRHKEWLTSFLSTYPRNKEVIEAIDNAISLLSAGELTPPDDPLAAGCNAIFWQKDFKSMSNGSGTTATGAKITLSCDFGADNPWCFRFENVECPIVNGIADFTNSTNRRYGTMRLNREEMAQFIHQIKVLLWAHELTAYTKAKEFVEKNNYYARTHGTK